MMTVQVYLVEIDFVATQGPSEFPTFFLQNYQSNIQKAAQNLCVGLPVSGWVDVYDIFYKPLIRAQRTRSTTCILPEGP